MANLTARKDRFKNLAWEDGRLALEYDIRFYNRQTYLHVEAHCEWTVNNAVRLIDLSRIEADKHGLSLILIDLSNWSTPKSDMVRYFSGEYLAEKFGPPFKVAAFANPEHINKFGENVAVNRGARFAMHSNHSDALEWLLEAIK